MLGAGSVMGLPSLRVEHIDRCFPKDRQEVISHVANGFSRFNQCARSLQQSRDGQWHGQLVGLSSVSFHQSDSIGILHGLNCGAVFQGSVRYCLRY